MRPNRLLSAVVRTVASGAIVCAAGYLAGCKPSPGTAGSGAPAPDPGKLFDGESLAGWKSIDFAGHGEVTVEDGNLILGLGESLTGVVLDSKPSMTMGYEISLEAKRLDGSDFFCGITFPVDESHCSFIVGGWGGGVVGISSIDSLDASENETVSFHSFEDNRWYKIRVRVTSGLLEAWLDDKQVVNFATKGRGISMRPGEIEDCVPFGLATFATKAALRYIRMDSVSGSE